MSEQQAVDITELAVLGEQFPLRLMQLGFRLQQVFDFLGYDQYRYVIPPVCTVSAGPFLMGSDKSRDDDAHESELPQHIVHVNGYGIGAYPLTVAEYACFVQVTNHSTPRNWIYQQQCPDHPVGGISWTEALAYAHWLAEVTGEGWRLPTEAEWEKAARGTDGRIYPWGDQWEDTRANIGDGEPGEIMPVGSYLGDVSPYGCYDMAGNVSEWTSTTYQPYPYQAGDGREDLHPESDKVLRGGAWDAYPQDARAADRSGVDPSYASFNIGIRLVRGEPAR